VGRYDEALVELRQMIEEFADAEVFLRDLYNELVKTIHQQLNAARDPEARARLEQQRENQARETLQWFPDIMAGVGYPSVEDLYDRLRAEMFGELEIVTSPDSCDVMIDEEYRGHSPFVAEYFPVGTHTVRIIKSGYEEKQIDVEVEPGGKRSTEIALEKIRGRGWWLTRVVTPVAIGVGVILAIALSGDDTQEQPPPDPLPGPPDPPAN
jgi:hypothetical protein